MSYFLTFLEGVVSFISPCVLPLLPIYLSYLTAENDTKSGKFTRALGFVLGYTIVFCILGIFAGTLGAVLTKYRLIVNIVCGTVVVLLGLSYLDIIKLKFLSRAGMQKKEKANSFLSAVLFGMIYSVSLTPCVGAFLGSAIMLAATSGSALKGALLLLIYSLGMGIPFLLSAVLIENLTGTFKWIKQHYKTINTVCGVFLIITGVLMACGLINKISELF